MAEPSPQEFFDVLFPDGLTAGELALYTTTFRSGNAGSSWCLNVPEADRLCINFRQTRRVRFSVALHCSKRALAIVRRRRGRAQLPSVRGCEASVSALPAFWIEIPYHPEADGRNTLPNLRQALDLLVAFDLRPSILYSTGATLCAFWLLERPWRFNLKDESAADKAEAKAMLSRLQWAIHRQAAEHGWPLAVNDDLAADFPVPGSLTGGSAKGPRATLLTFPLAAGDGRYRRRDFDSLPEPPAGDPRTWRQLIEQPASAAEHEPPAMPPSAVERCSKCELAPGQAGGTATGAPLPRTRIVITCRQHQVNDQAMAALAAGAELFEQDGSLVELVRAPGAAPRVRPVHGSRLRELLSRLCQFVLVPGKRVLGKQVSGEPLEVPPPRWTIRGLLTRGRWPELPRLASPRLELAPEPPVAADPHAEQPDVDTDAGLLAALDRVLDTLGGAATARRIAGALAAEPERFSELAAAMQRLWPELEPGGPAAAAALGYRFRGLKDRVFGGRTLIEARRTKGGVAWAVHRADVSPLANNRKEAA